jgi:competence protein ComEA
MRSGVRITPLEKRLLIITLIGFFILLGVVIDRNSGEETTKEFEERAMQDFPIDINKASAEDLEKLPMIGPVKAKAIVEYRKEHGPFQRLEDILEVSGIGEKTLERIRGYISVSASDVKMKSNVEENEKINVNTASVEDLVKLPGIGEIKAKRIVENRPYEKPEDLLRVPGIGVKTLEKIKDMVEF